jgi:hypothetical protein
MKEKYLSLDELDLEVLGDEFDDDEIENYDDDLGEDYDEEDY